MKIPIFEEIALTSLVRSDLKYIAQDSKIGKVPCYINLTSLSLQRLKDTVLILEDVILSENLNPLFPYPVYVVTPENIKTIFPTVRTIKDLPEHFFKKVKRPSNKELILLNKLTLKIDKIKNLKLTEIYNDLLDSAVKQKELYLVTKELHFLEMINFQLNVKAKRK